MIGINRIFLRLGYIGLVLISLNSTAAAEGVILSGELLSNDLLKVGVIQGDPSVSLIQASPYLSLSYKDEIKNTVFYWSYSFGLSDALLNWDARAMPNLLVGSGMLEAAACLEVNDAWALGMGMVPSAWNYFYTSSIDAKADVGWSGMQLNNNVGLWARYAILPDQQIIAGAGSNLILDSENVQNSNLKRMKVYALDRSFWIKYLPDDLPEVDLRFITNPMYDTVGMGARQTLAADLIVLADACWITTKSLLYENKDVYKLGLEFSTASIEISPNVSYIQRKVKQEAANEIRAAINVSVPLTANNNRLSLATNLKAESKESFDAHDRTGYDGAIDLNQNNGLYWNVHNAITAESYSDFIRYLEQNINTLHKSLVMAATLGLNIVIYNYDYNELNNDSSFWEDNLTNSASDEQIYDALKYGMINKQEMPVTVCRGFSRFIAKMFNASNLPDVAAYAVRVSYHAQAHVVTMIAAPDQIYIADYYDIIQSKSHDVETAFEVYQNLFSYPSFNHHIFNDDGALVGIVDTPDGRLLQEAMTVSKADTPDEQLKSLAVRVMRKK